MNIVAALFSDLTLLIIALVSILVIGTARFIDFLLGESGTTSLKPHLVEAYIVLGGMNNYSFVFRFVISRFNHYLQRISGEGSSLIKRISWFFLISFVINLLFLPWVSSIVDGYTSDIRSSPNYMIRSYIPYYYHVPLALLSIFIQSTWDTISILLTYYVVRKIARGERGTGFVFFDIASLYFLWTLTVSFSIYVTQMVSAIGWRCFGVVFNQLYGPEYEYMQCGWNKLLGSSERVSGLADIFIKTVLLDFRYPMSNAGDAFNIPLAPVLLMSATTLWPTTVYLLASVIISISVFFFMRLRRLSMVIVNRLDEKKSGLFNTVGTAISVVLAAFTITIKIISHFSG